MATPAPAGMQKTPPSRSFLFRCIAITILAVFVLTGIVVLITWLVIRPRSLVYTVEEGLIHGYDLKNNHLNATFNFVLRAYNPNSKVSVYYDSIEVAVLYDDETVAFDIIEPFYQPRQNITRLYVKPQARSTPLLESASKDLKISRSSGEVELAVRMKAKIRFKVGIWKSTKHTLRVSCSPVVVHMSSSKIIERTYCDVDV